jgi:putative GTP pyrophosphokinase
VLGSLKISNTQIDRLGDRLRSKCITDADLELLSDFRHSFGPAYETVVEILRNSLKLEPTGRPEKSTSSIADKLRRESLRLRQMQDIAGCRVIVGDVRIQDESVICLTKSFADASVVDRRIVPSHGYRAVHVIVRQHGIPVKIQVRTELQHSWAQLSEKLSDVVAPDIKYGGGPEPLKSMLLRVSELVGKAETLESRLLELENHADHPEFIQLSAEFVEAKQQLADRLNSMIEQGRVWNDDLWQDE